MSQNDKDFAPINIDVDERRPSGKRPAPIESDSATGGSNVFTSIVLVVAIAACAGCAYLYSELKTANTEAARTDSRLQSLEQRLSATGEEMGNSTVALQVKVTELAEKTEELWEQMDKLWASAWRRNQDEIKNLRGELNTTKANANNSIQKLEGELASASTNVQQVMNRINGLNEKISAQANDILSANVNAEQAGEKVSAQVSQLKSLNDKVKLLEARNASLLEKISDLEALLQEIAKKTV
jgi:chromosome segregation ATPase